MIFKESTEYTIEDGERLLMESISNFEKRFYDSDLRINILSVSDAHEHADTKKYIKHLVRYVYGT